MDNDKNNDGVAIPSLLGVMGFRFHWKTGKPEDAEGKTVEEAFASLGYCGGAVAALDYWEQLPTQSP